MCSFDGFVYLVSVASSYSDSASRKNCVSCIEGWELENCILMVLCQILRLSGSYLMFSERIRRAHV